MSRLGVRIPLVGRAEELGRLRRTWKRAQDGSACAVLISGDAGVGKSRLVDELADVAEDDATVLRGHCVGLGQAGPPYLAFFETLDQIRHLAPELVERFDILSSLTGTATASGQPHEQLQLFDAVLGILTALSADRPVLWIVEDLHWADASMRDLLRFLIARLERQRLMVALTYRSDDLHRTHPLRPLLTDVVRMGQVEWVELQPFDAEHAHDFVQELAKRSHLTHAQDAAHGITGVGPHRGGAASLDELIDRVAARSEGNAFFAEELLHSPDATPRGPLADVLLSRVDALSEPARRVAQQVAVAGQRTVTHTTLALIVADLSPDDLDAALRECVDHHVLVPGPQDSYGFRHALLREAIYADLLPGQRTRMHAEHAAVLATLSRPGLCSARAYHAKKSNDLPTALAAYVESAQEASALAAPADELRHLESALELWDAVTDAEQVAGVDQFTVVVSAVDAAAAAGRHDRQLAFARTAVDLADTTGEPRRRADARRRVAKALDAPSGNDGKECRDLLAEAWAMLEDDEPSTERAWVLAQLAFGGRSDERRRWAELAIADAQQVGNGAAEADALVSLAFQNLRDGDVQACIDTLTRALARAQAAGAHGEAVRVLFNLAITELEAGDLDRAAQHIDAGLDYARNVGLTWAMYGRELASLAATCHLMRGTWDEAVVLGSSTAEQHADWVTSVLASSAALVHAYRGEWDDLHAALGRVEESARAEGKPAMTRAFALTEQHLWQQRPDQALAAMRHALAVLGRGDPEFSDLASVRVHAIAIAALADLAARARHRGDEGSERESVTAGTEHRRRAEEAFAHGKARSAEAGPEAHAWLARVRAEAGRLRGESEASAWQAVIEAFGYGEIYWQAHAHWRLGESLLAPEGGQPADRPAGEQILGSALETATRLRAVPLQEAIRALARRHRIVLPGGRDHVDLLTPREQAVLDLVARGLTNRAIGAELFISAKTVSVHVSRVMAKVGASSRTEAVARAIQRGLLTP